MFLNGVNYQCPGKSTEHVVSVACWKFRKRAQRTKQCIAKNVDKNNYRIHSKVEYDHFNATTMQARILIGRFRTVSCILTSECCLRETFYDLYFISCFTCCYIQHIMDTYSDCDKVKRFTTKCKRAPDTCITS